MILLDGDGTLDLDFLDLVGESQLKHLLATRVGLLSGEAGKEMTNLAQKDLKDLKTLS